MKVIRYTTTLYYYDGPQVVEARDAIGGHYVGVALEPGEGGERYLLAGVEPERLRQFRMGAIDLRSLLVERSETEWFVGTARGELLTPFSLEVKHESLASFAHLPEAGFLLHDAPAMAKTIQPAPMKAVALNEAQSTLDKLFEEAQAGSPVLLVRGGEIAKLERMEPPEFGGDLATLEKMLVDAVEGAHAEWPSKDPDDIARRAREKRRE